MASLYEMVLADCARMYAQGQKREAVRYLAHEWLMSKQEAEARILKVLADA